MKICLVTAFPPSRRGLNEYGFHLARELKSEPLLSLTILADELDGEEEELPDYDVIRCWRFDSFSNPARLLKTIRDIKPDVVWFNLLFSTFGHSPIPAFLGLAQPAISRLSGRYTHVTLHHLMDNIDLADSGVRFHRLYRSAGSAATRFLLMANSVSVLLPVYRRTLIEKYRGENVYFRAHGILGGCPEPPDFQRRGNPEHRILAFGKWGTYKRLEALIEAFRQLESEMPNIRLIIAGSNHPSTPGYVESIAASTKGTAGIEFIGYVAEENIADLFRRASVVVLPYSSATGASGVAHLACEFGVPIVSADIPDFREMAGDEGLAVDFYDTGKTAGLLDHLRSLLNDDKRLRDMAEQNFSAALRMTMPQIIRQYLRSFDLQQRAAALERIARFRRIPSWVPSRSAIFRAATPGWHSWT
jgi:glycosyltransferase involved in cell wall biosynthesis